MSTKSYHHGDLKEALISSARKILIEEGADALSLRAIAADVGVSHMAPYAHFKNKKALFQAIAAFGFNQLAKSMIESANNTKRAQDLILAYGVTYLKFAIDNPQLYRLMLGQIETSGRRNKTDNSTPINISENKPVVSSELETSSRRPFLLLRSAFSDVSKDDDAAKTNAQALGAWSMVHGMAALIIEGHFTIPKGISLKKFLAMAAIQSEEH